MPVILMLMDLQYFWVLFLAGLNSTALCPYGRGDIDTFRCLFLFALQIPRLPHGVERRSKECGSLTNPDAINSSEYVTGLWDSNC